MHKQITHYNPPPLLSQWIGYIICKKAIYVAQSTFGALNDTDKLSGAVPSIIKTHYREQCLP